MNILDERSLYPRVVSVPESFLPLHETTGKETYQLEIPQEI